LPKVLCVRIEPTCPRLKPKVIAADMIPPAVTKPAPMHAVMTFASRSLAFVSGPQASSIFSTPNLNSAKASSDSRSVAAGSIGGGTVIGAGNGSVISQGETDLGVLFM